MQSMNKERLDEIDLKCLGIRNLMNEYGLSGIFLRQQKNFAWITAGATNPVVINHDPGFAGILITDSSRFVLTQNVEAPRLEAEELDGLGFKAVTSSWWDEDVALSLKELVAGSLGCDVPMEGALLVENEISLLRPTLTAGEISRISGLGVDVGKGLALTAGLIEPGMTEFEVAGLMGRALVSEGIRPVLYLVAADERVSLFRHAVPTAKKLDKYLVMSVCAERSGLIVAATRVVHFGAVPESTRKKYEDLLRVDSVFISECRPGADIHDAFAAGCASYDRFGYPDEWKKHYQGGLIGYAEREVLALPETRFEIKPGQALAWNPTITGTKTEDTFLVQDSGFTNITLDESWPSREIESGGTCLMLPEILVR